MAWSCNDKFGGAGPVWLGLVWPGDARKVGNVKAGSAGCGRVKSGWVEQVRFGIVVCGKAWLGKTRPARNGRARSGVGKSSKAQIGDAGKARSGKVWFGRGWQRIAGVVES